ncbi:FAD-binding protein [Tessaracoccus defluvii]|uniref:FAD-dependent oxidoreductase 2 FAD-binding domain-containing protein n=1 Tax=Tessaracoccus defluvii TaxID=1285901 RepID=A0A7H0H918_9ACTN|nr:FAD-binding protein [Tessaracoccus defluvii]QNP57034.1 hypothetical protein H9L22_06900 [Tessaracoccus defluvii]
MVIIRGAGLAGLAAAARLARLGHEVTLATGGTPLGDAYAPGVPTNPDPLGTITLPAAWRDLFKKSGGHLTTELNRAHLTLVEADPVAVDLGEGDLLRLPAERGAQFRAIGERLGEAEAARWRDLIDSLDDAWIVFRRHALEGTTPVTTPGQRAALLLDVSAGDLADRVHPALGRLVVDAAGTPGAPGVEALPLAVERTFGRWRLVAADGTARPGTSLVGLLTTRLAERGVQLADEPPGPVDIDCVPAGPVGRAHDAAAWLARTPIAGADGRLRASAASPAGTQPWAELGSAALAVYALHERLTGEDCRPTNVDFRLPRLPQG